VAFASDGPAVVTTPLATSFIDRNSNGAHQGNQHACRDLQRVVDSGTVRPHTADSGHSLEDKSTAGTNWTEGSDWPD
jgi:hypothetical protein